MKRKTLFLCMCFSVVLSVTTSAQIIQSDSSDFSVQQFDRKINHYLQRSKEQKKLAWILLGSGATLSFLGIILDDNSNSTGVADNLTEVGALATATSIPLFFSAFDNKNNARLVLLEKNVAMATSDSLKTIYINDAANYFSDKSKINLITAVVLSASGTALIIAAIGANANANSNNLAAGIGYPLLYGIGGIAFAIASVPFYMRSAHLNKTAKIILQTQSIPNPDFGTKSLYSGRRQNIALGIRIFL